MTQGVGDLLQKVSERHEQRLSLVRWHLRLNLAAYQVYYCYVAGHGYSYAEVTGCSVAVRLVLCRRSRLAASQVMVCSAAGQLFWVGPATLYALQQRFPSPVLGKQSDLRHQGGRPATPDGEPASPEWQTCDAVGITAAISVAGYGLQCGRSAFLGRTCDTICLTAAISVAGPRQRIGPATPDGETCDTRVRDQRRRSGRPATPEGQADDTRSGRSATKSIRKA